MSSLQDLGSWGSNLLGQVGTHLGPAAGAVGGLASSGLQKGSDLVRTSAKAVKSFTNDNLSGRFGATHSFNLQGNEVCIVTEVARIAEGGFGEVMKVVDSKTGEAFALKKIACQEGVQVAATLEEAEREAKILLRLPQHPNIVRCLGFATEATPGGGHIVKMLMEMCCGGHLLDFMDSKDGKLSAREVLEPFTQIVSAVRHLHVQRPPIQHRDLKVENVLQGEGGKWKLCDFGSCSTERIPAQELPRPRLMQLQEEFDKTVTMMYRPPEMADIELNFRKGYSITEQVDIWMLGCVFYTLAFYRQPFQDNATAMAISNAKYFIPFEHPLAKSPKLVALIHWLLAADPKDRPSALKLCEVLGGISKMSYESFHDSLPAAVQEKIKRIKDMSAKKGIDADVPIPLDVLSRGSQTSQRRQSAPTANSQQTRAAAVTPKPRSNTAGARQNPVNDQDGFDLRFALQPELMAGASSGAPRQDGEANTSGTQKSSVAPPPPMISNDLMSLTSPDDVTVGGIAAVTPQAATVSAMPDMHDLLGFSSASEPAAPFTASFPDASQSAPMPTQGSSPAVQDADWCDFSSFSPTPVPMMQTGASANTPLAQSAVSSPCAMHGTTPSTLNNSLGEFDFADFVSASPTPAAYSPAHITSTPLFAEGHMPTNTAIPTVPSMPTAWAAAAPPPVVPVANPAASLPNSMQAAGKPAQTAPAGKLSGEATTDLSAMLSQQVNLLDLT